MNGLDGEVSSLSRSDERERALTSFSLHLKQVTGYKGALPTRVVERATVDPLFLGQLVVNRHRTKTVECLVEGMNDQPLPEWTPSPTLSLIGKAALGLSRWATIGFRSVNNETKERRRRACLICPNLKKPTGQKIYNLAGSAESLICGLCSCSIDKKVEIPTETCPAASTHTAGLNRWDEVED